MRKLKITFPMKQSLWMVESEQVTMVSQCIWYNIWFYQEFGKHSLLVRVSGAGDLLSLLPCTKGNLSPTPPLNLTKVIRRMTMWRTASRKWQLGSGQLSGLEEKKKRFWKAITESGQWAWEARWSKGDEVLTKTKGEWSGGEEPK